MEIREDDLTGLEIQGLLRGHLEHMQEITPPGSVHALDLDGLRAPGITLWSAWEGGRLLGCGALKELDAASGEIKAMRTEDSLRRTGVGSQMLGHLVAEARRRGYRRLYLETGALPEFEAARSFYLKHGFEFCGPFADYVDDGNSAFMQRWIEH